MKKIKFWQFIKEGRPTSDNSPLGNFRNVQSVRRHCLNNERVSDRYSECVSMKTLQEIFNEIIAKEDIGKDFVMDWISINYLFSKTDNTMRNLWKHDNKFFNPGMKIIYNMDNPQVNSIIIQFNDNLKTRACDFGLKISNAINNHAVFEKLLNNLNRIYKYHPKTWTTFGQLFSKIKEIFPPDVISKDLVNYIKDIPEDIKNKIIDDDEYLYKEIGSLQKFRNYYIHNSNYDSRMYNIVDFDKSEYGIDFITSIHIKCFCIYLCGIYIIMNRDKLGT